MSDPVLISLITLAGSIVTGLVIVIPAYFLFRIRMIEEAKKALMPVVQEALAPLAEKVSVVADTVLGTPASMGKPAIPGIADDIKHVKQQTDGLLAKAEENAKQKGETVGREKAEAKAEDKASVLAEKATSLATVTLDDLEKARKEAYDKGVAETLAKAKGKTGFQ